VYYLKHKYAWAASIIGTILVLDQFTKWLIQTRVRLYDVHPVITGFFNITHVRNRGAAFGVLANLPDQWRTVFFVAITLFAVAVIVVLIRKTDEWLPVSAFSLIAAGAVGNAIDRVRYGEVVDFIQWYVKSYYWPSFNVADSAISVGVGLLMISMLFHKEAGPLVGGTGESENRKFEEPGKKP
jgi:signal peptidase II